MEIKDIIELLNFSNLTWQIATPVVFSMADIITGFIQAVINRDVDSSKMRTGLLHKTLILIIEILSFVLDCAFSLSFVSKVVCTYIVIMEIVSILENLKKAGIETGILSEILLDKKGGNSKNEIK